MSGFVFLHDILRPTNHARGVGGHDLTQGKPIEDHADGGELYFDRRRRDPLLQCFDIRRDVDRLHVAELIEAAVLAPGGEVVGGLGIGLPGIGVTDIGGEEFDDALCGSRVRLIEGGEGEGCAGPDEELICYDDLMCLFHAVPWVGESGIIPLFMVGDSRWRSGRSGR